MAKSQSSEPGSWAADIIREFIEKSPENTLQNEADEKAFGTPLWAFQRETIPSTRTIGST